MMRMRITKTYHGLFSVKAAVCFCVLLTQLVCIDHVGMPDYLLLNPPPEVFVFPDSSRNDLDNPYRYIAHAGGIYDGMAYTNTLEALDSSYGKGFKLFELDLLLTADNRIVAFHDWALWQFLTGYEGDIPPTLDVFKSFPVCGTLTPLSMSDIVSWFSLHGDAVLITDKIEDYAKLASEFPFPDRLMVEVFSVIEYADAYHAGIKYPLLSVEWAKKDASRVVLDSFVAENGVPLAVIPVETIESNIARIRTINANNGCVFAFTSNDPGFLPLHDELFGVYTDSINFSLLSGSKQPDIRNGKSE
jgi:hypothetical protein